MRGSRVTKIVLDDFGACIYMEKGCYVVRDKHENTRRYPMFENEIGEVILKSGNMISTGALASLGWWEIDTLILTRKGKPVAYLKDVEDDSHVKTRICQYEALKDGRGVYIARQVVISKYEGQNRLLEKYGLEPHSLDINSLVDNVESSNYRKRLMLIESKFSKRYFKQLFSLIPGKIRPVSRRNFKAYNGMNNVFNLAYTILSWKVHKALLKAKLEPFLGFLHSIQKGKPSLICDFNELYRYLIDDFVIGYSQDLKKKNFIVKSESVSRRRKGKRQYLNDSKTGEMLRLLNEYFDGKVEIPRIRVGKRQSLETLINEEALLLAKYLRNEKNDWIPRVTTLK